MKYKGFYVEGTTLFDANGVPFVMRGFNHPNHCFAYLGNVFSAAISGIASTGANTVRIGITDGNIKGFKKDSAADVAQFIEICKNFNVIAMLDFHDNNENDPGNTDTKTLENAVNYWIEIKDALIGNEAYAIVNILNEWGAFTTDFPWGEWDGQIWRNEYIKAVKRLRESGIRNTLIIDAAGYGQDSSVILKHGRSVFEADPLLNTIYSIHMYQVSGADEETVKTTIDGALSINIPVIIGEFSHVHFWEGSHLHKVDYETILSYCHERNVGYLAWFWTENGEWKGETIPNVATNSLRASVDWEGSRLTAEWGEPLVNSKYGIRSTSKQCSVF